MRLQHVEGVEVALIRCPTAGDRGSLVPGKPRGDGKGHGNMSRCREHRALCLLTGLQLQLPLHSERTARDFRVGSSRWADLGRETEG